MKTTIRWFARKRAALAALSLEGATIATFAFFVIFVIFALLFLLACHLGAIVPAIAFFAGWMISGTLMVIGIMVAEARMNEPRRYEYLIHNRGATGREFRI